jgi:iron-sulfur cluster repair protein YtfE (RIC family)
MSTTLEAAAEKAKELDAQRAAEYAQRKQRRLDQLVTLAAGFVEVHGSRNSDPCHIAWQAERLLQELERVA